jgi:hypothetical protein
MEILKNKIKNTDAENSVPISTYTWHMSTRWYTSDLHVVTADIMHLFGRGTKACIPAQITSFQASAVRTRQLASLRRLLQIACQPRAS